ncbi:MAG: hypothetical protein KF752_08945 [Pirellulaceae bacterium]|nr:hypothetical protein [Pirellulaceae bacterium]
MTRFEPHRWAYVSKAINWLLGQVRFGAEPDQAWRPYHESGAKDCPTAFLVIGGLSSNGVHANRELSKTLHHTWGEAETWSRNLSGHTGNLFDFSGSRFWHWIADGVKSLRELTLRHAKTDIVLVGHSTGGLVVLALAILSRLFPRWFSSEGQPVRVRGVLIFPPFRLKRSRDAALLGIVGILYYLVCPAAFLLLAFSGRWMWPMSLLAFLLHIMLVPQISVPSGEERARQEAQRSQRSPRWIDIPENVLLGLACLYFVAAPPLIALGASVLPGIWSSGVFALFITSLLTPLFLMPRHSPDNPVPVVSHTGGYQWMPIITVANLIILQWILKPLLGLVRCPVLIMEAELDEVVYVDPSWSTALRQAPAQTICLKGYPHSRFSTGQQTDLARLIVRWCQQN